MSVREAAEADLAWCLSTDRHLEEAALLSKIRAGEILVVESDGAPAGLLRLDLMWSAVPFIAQLRVLATYRRERVGQALLLAVEARARARGSIAVLSSSHWGPTVRLHSVGTKRLHGMEQAGHQKGWPIQFPRDSWVWSISPPTSRSLLAQCLMPQRPSLKDASGHGRAQA